MTIEEAIGYFQQKHRCFPDVCGCRDCGAERVAIQALREKQERENPELCEYCGETGKPIKLDDRSYLGVWGTKRGKKYTAFNYCSMCGRKLVNHAD